MVHSCTCKDAERRVENACNINQTYRSQDKACIPHPQLDPTRQAHMHISREGLFNRFFSRTTRRPSYPAPALTAQALPPKDVTHKQGQTASTKHQVTEEAAVPEDGEAPVLTTTLQHKFVTRIHGKYYNLEGFKHPGGPVALSLIGGRDGTPLFESHHPFTSQDKLQAILGKHLIPGMHFCSCECVSSCEYVRAQRTQKCRTEIMIKRSNNYCG